VALSLLVEVAYEQDEELRQHLPQVPPVPHRTACTRAGRGSMQGGRLVWIAV
jgi:hypothetical protein